MTTRKKKSDVTTDEEIPSLGALLSDTGNIERDTYGDIDPAALQRLVYMVTAIGGYCTQWYDSVNGRLCVSMRLGTERKSYQAEEAEQWNMIAESIVGKLAPAVRKKEQPPPPPPTPIK